MAVITSDSTFTALPHQTYSLYAIEVPLSKGKNTGVL
jgi:hypothetical protein